jgi:hypothetical protein
MPGGRALTEPQHQPVLVQPGQSHGVRCFKQCCGSKWGSAHAFNASPTLVCLMTDSQISQH